MAITSTETIILIEGHLILNNFFVGYGSSEINVLNAKKKYILLR